MRHLPDTAWDEVMQAWNFRNQTDRGVLAIYTIDTDEGTLEFLAKEAVREVSGVLSRGVAQG